MITLTTPPQVNSVLGGSAPIPYNHLVLSPFSLDPKTLLITGTISLTSTGNPSMQPITGTLRINNSTGVLTVEVPQLDFYRQVQLSGPQIASVNTIIANAQNAIESGLVSLGVIAGVQSTGA
jgi:hypothetical protein